MLKNVFLVFITGLFSGGISCLAVQAGLLGSLIAQERVKNQNQTHIVLSILYFLGSKLLVYTLLGALLGALGSVLLISVKMQMLLQFGVGLFMIGTALALLNVHSFFQIFIIRPPKFLYKFANKNTLNTFFAPAFLGALTVLVPCGATQGVMAQAVASASWFWGGALMFAFVFGTLPLFFAAGVFAQSITFNHRRILLKFASVCIILLAFFNLNNGLALSGSTYTLGNIARGVFCSFAYCEKPETQNLVTTQIITINSSGYAPRFFSVPRGEKITINLVNQGGSGCQQAFTIPKLNIQKIIPVSGSGSVSFVAPNQKTQLAFTCSMGMYTGIISVN
jgi:sulfite exporter TauE/SafE